MKWERLPPGEIAARFEEANGPLHCMKETLALLKEAAAIKDRIGRILWMNSAAEKMWGVSLKEAIGKTMPAVAGDYIGKHSIRQDAEILKTKVGQAFYVPSQNEGKPSYSVIKFPFRCAEGDTLICVIRTRLTQGHAA